MSFAIKHGLFKLNIIDHHAVLGVSIDAEPKQIRLRYLKIANQLHPDKCRFDRARMKQAGIILSKLVNPAYEQLSRKSAFAEHQLVLTQIGKKLAENKDKVVVNTQQAQELLNASGSAELSYRKLLKQLVVHQYESLKTAAGDIEAISELNMVYLMLTSDRVAYTSANRAQNRNVQDNDERSPQKTVAQKQEIVSQASPETSDEPIPESRVAAFVNRAQQYIAKGEFDRAIKELKDALRIDPNHGIAHAVMGRAYLHKKQLTMAKVHIGKAFNADPHNQIVMDSKKALDRLTKADSRSKASNPGSANKNSSSGNSGFFSGFFGSKKK